MKKFIALLFALVFCISACACGLVEELDSGNGTVDTSTKTPSPING